MFFLVVTLLAFGCAPQVLSPLLRWMSAPSLPGTGKRASRQSGFHEHLVLGHKRDLGQVPADGCRVKMHKAIVWMAMARAVPRRLWLGRVISPIGIGT